MTFGRVDIFFADVMNVTIWILKKQNFKAVSTLEPPSGFESGSCVVDIDILITFRNGDRKIMRSVRITSRHPVTVCVMLRNNFQMLKKNCWKAKKDFPLPVFTIFIGLWVATFFLNLRTTCLSICLFLVP